MRRQITNAQKLILFYSKSSSTHQESRPQEGRQEARRQEGRTKEDRQEGRQEGRRQEGRTSQMITPSESLNSWPSAYVTLFIKFLAYILFLFIIKS